MKTSKSDVKDGDPSRNQKTVSSSAQQFKKFIETLEKTPRRT